MYLLSRDHSNYKKRLIAAWWFPGSFPCNFHGLHFYSLVVMKSPVKVICLAQDDNTRTSAHLFNSSLRLPIFNLRGTCTFSKLCFVVLFRDGMKDFWNERFRRYGNSPCTCSLIGMMFMESLSASWHQSREVPWRTPRGLYRVFYLHIENEYP